MIQLPNVEIHHLAVQNNCAVKSRSRTDGLMFSVLSSILSVNTSMDSAELLWCTPGFDVVVACHVASDATDIRCWTRIAYVEKWNQISNHLQMGLILLSCCLSLSTHLKTNMDTIYRYSQKNKLIWAGSLNKALVLFLFEPQKKLCTYIHRLSGSQIMTKPLRVCKSGRVPL